MRVAVQHHMHASQDGCLNRVADRKQTAWQRTRTMHPELPSAASLLGKTWTPVKVWRRVSTHAIRCPIDHRHTSIHRPPPSSWRLPDAVPPRPDTKGIRRKVRINHVHAPCLTQRAANTDGCKAQR